MQRRTTQGQGLTRERVLQAGLNVIDRAGIDALTMRRLAAELGVKAMSLYGYVDNKQDLLDGVLDVIYAEVPLQRRADHDANGNGNGTANENGAEAGDVSVDGSGAGRGSWQDELRTTARLFRKVLLRHPKAVPLVAGRPVMATGPQQALLADTVAALGAAGLDVVHASAVVTVVLSFTIGHVASEVGRTAGGPRAAAAERPDSDTEFGLGLDFIVTGVEDLIHPLTVGR
jgi:TetR/AcrR family transcriptional regulator, tetracycline repressor protein